MTLTVRFYNDTTKAWEDLSTATKLKAVLPVKSAELLDEQLDEMELTLKHIPIEYFKPLTLFEITETRTSQKKYTAAYFAKVQARAQTPVTSTFENGRITQTKTSYYVVANDNSNELMGVKVRHGLNTGKSAYNHQIYLIEITKISEGFIGDAITYTNALGNDYVGG